LPITRTSVSRTRTMSILLLLSIITPSSLSPILSLGLALCLLEFLHPLYSSLVYLYPTTTTPSSFLLRSCLAFSPSYHTHTKKHTSSRDHLYFSFLCFLHCFFSFLFLDIHLGLFFYLSFLFIYISL
jgi:hypothetical protein